jgi:hypothetical protein
MALAAREKDPDYLLELPEYAEALVDALGPIFSDIRPAATMVVVAGLLDLQKRRLIPEPGGHFRSLAGKPEILGV